MFYKENEIQTYSGSALLLYLAAQILKIYLLGANHCGTLVGSLWVPACPRKLWIRHYNLKQKKTTTFDFCGAKNRNLLIKNKLIIIDQKWSLYKLIGC